jgi:predicted  nucleic acid-binding Zn-ribbon protein
MAVDDSIQVRCTRCKGKFRDKARRVRDGYSRQCPSCECLVFFLEGSPNKDVQQALREAERVRKLLREEEHEKILARAASAAQDVDGEPAPALSRRMERRSPSAGRSRRR